MPFSIKRVLESKKQEGVALIIASQPIELGYFEKAWDAATLRVCADGGMARLMDYNPELTPDYIVGDMDSMDESTRAKYQGRCKIVHVSDQDSTDLEKSLSFVFEREGKETALVVGALNGVRMDHTLNGFHCCLKYLPKTVVLLDRQAVAFAIRGKIDLEIDHATEGPECGIFPLQQPCRVNTRGLQWNVDGRQMAMGSFVSVSNRLASGSVALEVDHPAIFTMGLR